jgi:plastocyanin
MNRGRTWPVRCLTFTLLLLATLSSRANTIEVDWTSSGFSPSQITINAGDEVDIVNFDDTFDLQLTGAPPEGFSAYIPATDGVNIYYVPYVYQHPGTFSFSDEFGDSTTVTVQAVLPLSVTITAPANNAVFSAPANFTFSATPAGGATPYSDMEFFVGTNSTADIFSAPFTSPVANLPAGNYTLTAVITDANFNTATNSINISVGVAQITRTNYILPVVCADIYSSGSVLTNSYLSTGGNIHGALEFAAFNAGAYSSILLELNAYALPLFDTNVSVYGFDGGTGVLAGSNFNSGTLIGVWTLPAGLGYGQVTTYDVTAFVKSAKGPYFGFILQAPGGDTFSSTTYNYGTPPELFAITTITPRQLAATQAGNKIIISWPTNDSAGLTLQASVTPGPGATWSAVTPVPALVGGTWVVTNTISGPGRFYRLSNH